MLEYLCLYQTNINIILGNTIYYICHFMRLQTEEVLEYF